MDARKLIQTEILRNVDGTTSGEPM